jgi:hypothetical protein
MMQRRVGHQLTHALCQLYPRAWRDRYEPELRDLLDRQPVTAFTLLDLALSALDLRRHPAQLPSEVFSMTSRVRSSLVSILVPSVLFAAAWVTILTVRDPLSAWIPATAAHRDLFVAVSLVQLAGFVAVLGLLAGGLPVVVSLFTTARRTRDDRVIRRLRAAIIAFVIFLVLAGAAGAGWFVPVNAAFGSAPVSLAWALGILLSVAVGVAALTHALWWSALDPKVLRLAFRSAVVVAAAMVVALVSSVVVTLLVAGEAPDIGAPWLGLVPMAIATAWSILALRRGTQSPLPA